MMDTTFLIGQGIGPHLCFLETYTALIKALRTQNLSVAGSRSFRAHHSGLRYEDQSCLDVTCYILYITVYIILYIVLYIYHMLYVSMFFEKRL